MIPPRAAWDAVQEVRCVRDKSYLRWMPHANLLYPFLEDDASGETFAEAAAIAADALKETSPFRCSLRAFAFFEHARSSTVWLHPAACPGVDEEWAARAAEGKEGKQDTDDDALTSCELAEGNSRSLEPGPPACPPAAPGLMAAQTALEGAFPFANHLSSVSAAGFVPHVSVGQWPDAVSASAAAANLRAKWSPVEFDVDAVFLISRPSDGSGPFRVRARVPLGGGGRRGSRRTRRAKRGTKTRAKTKRLLRESLSPRRSGTASRTRRPRHRSARGAWCPSPRAGAARGARATKTERRRRNKRERRS